MSGDEAASRLRIRDLEEGMRPRERAAAVGVENASTETLLAILLRTGGKRGQSVIELARELLDRNGGSLGRLAGMGYGELKGVPGMGNVKALEVAAAFELGRRAAAEERGGMPVIAGPADLVPLLREEARELKQEKIWLAGLDQKRRLIRRPEEITRGILNASHGHPREIFRAAIRMSAASVIVAHNHPSGDPTPSREDVALTERLVAAGELVGIPVLDHIVIGGGAGETRWASLRARGLGGFRGEP